MKDQVIQNHTINGTLCQVPTSTIPQSGNAKSRLDRAFLGDITKPRITTIKEAKEILTISELWEHFELPGYPAKSCISPFRHERSPSFSVYVNAQGEERFKDHGDPDVKGDSYDFYQQCTELESQAAFEAFVQLAKKLRDQGPSSSLRGRHVLNPEPKPLPRNFKSRARAMCENLTRHKGSADQFAKKRGWKEATVLQLAAEGCLGYYKPDYCPALIYSTGIKIRYESFGERKIYWLLGQGSIWRAERMVDARQVYLCEGETDAISLIDAGIESLPEVAVVAAPSATTFDPAWAPLFADKDVVLCMDDDDAGKKAERRIGKMIEPYAASLSLLNLKGALQ